MFKKILTVICVSLLILSAFAGCTEKKNTENNESYNNADIVSATESTPDPNDKILGVDMGEDESTTVSDSSSTSPDVSSESTTSGESSDTSSEEDNELGDNVINIDDLFG